MNKYIIIFSPTGGTEKVANAITKSWDTVKDIDLSRTDLDYSSISLTKEDIAVIAMPSFGGVAPQLALDRLAKIGGNQCKCTIVAYAVKAGVHVIAAVSAVAEHSILHQYATGRPDENDSKQLTEFGNQILEKREVVMNLRQTFRGIDHIKNPVQVWFQKQMLHALHVDYVQINACRSN